MLFVFISVVYFPTDSHFLWISSCNLHNAFLFMTSLLCSLLVLFTWFFFDCFLSFVGTEFAFTLSFIVVFFYLVVPRLIRTMRLGPVLNKSPCQEVPPRNKPSNPGGAFPYVQTFRYRILTRLLSPHQLMML